MAKKESYEWYVPLQGYFDDNMMSRENFAAIEAVLHLLTTYAEVPEAEKAYSPSETFPSITGVAELSFTITGALD